MSIEQRERATYSNDSNTITRVYICHLRVTTGNPEVYTGHSTSFREIFKLRQAISVASLMTHLSYEYVSRDEREREREGDVLGQS